MPFGAQASPDAGVRYRLWAPGSPPAFAVAELLADFPVAMLVSEERGEPPTPSDGGRVQSARADSGAATDSSDARSARTP